LIYQCIESCWKVLTEVRMEVLKAPDSDPWGVKIYG